MDPRISVIIPLFNARSYIAETLDSVAAQTLRAHEVIVVDDGSVDGSGDLARAHPLRPRVLTRPNGGPAAARNLGVAASSGELLALLDADDLWLPDKLARQAAALAARPDAGATFAHFELLQHGSAGPTVWAGVPDARPPTLRDLLLRGNRVGTLTAMVRRAAWDRVGPMDEDRRLIGVEDFGYWLRLARVYPLLFDPVPLARYRVHPGNLVGGDLQRVTSLEVRAVAKFLAAEPGLTRELFGIPSGAFQFLRVARFVVGRVGKRRALLPGSLRAIARGWAELASR